jgi:hypothetical protein
MLPQEFRDPFDHKPGIKKWSRTRDHLVESANLRRHVGCKADRCWRGIGLAATTEVAYSAVDWRPPNWRR